MLPEKFDFIWLSYLRGEDENKKVYGQINIGISSDDKSFVCLFDWGLTPHYNIFSIITRLSVLLGEEARVPRENH